MQHIKKYNEYEKLNESWVVVTLAVISIIKVIIAITQIKKLESMLTKDIHLTNKLKDITGYDINVYKSDQKELKKVPAFAANDFVAYNNELKNTLTERELIAVLLHEYSHIKSKAFTRNIITQLFLNIPLLFLTGWMYFFLSRFIKMVGVSAISRIEEYKCDSYAHKFGYGNDLSYALIKIGNKYKKSLIDIEKLQSAFGQLTGIFSSHPNVYKRIKRIYSKSVNEKDFVEMVDDVKSLKKDPLLDQDQYIKTGSKEFSDTFKEKLKRLRKNEGNLFEKEHSGKDH